VLEPVPVTVSLPRGFVAHVANIGIKDDTDDLVVVACERSVPVAAVFTRSRFAGASVELSRANLALGSPSPAARAVVVISKNANVATGEQGRANAREVVETVARRLGCAPAEVLLASTGVIGRQYPMDAVRAGLGAMPARPGITDAAAVAGAIMTTDTVPKIAECAVAGPTPAGGDRARVVGVAKGVGMIEPDMATLIALVFTDADVDQPDLDAAFRRAVDRTLNCVSVDTDTSTSDTAVILASGAAGPVDRDEFESALRAVLESLTKQIARDGEGAETLIEVRVDGARDGAQAKRVAKSIVNSPLVKTAVHGADPNWGRVAMAIGKCGDADIAQESVVIRFGDQEVYPNPVDADGLRRLSAYMSGDEVTIHVSLGIAGGTATVWGCDLTDGYVRINADYTT